ncbi:MAG: hypothetical protein QOJ38_1917 [Solirubrobacterales bacterium]|nr:hypothetical protein [Solirubrobacterales bacterium]
MLIGEDAVYRVLSERGLADWRALADSQLFAAQTAAGALVGTEQLPAGEGPVGDGASALVTEAAAVLRHERIPLVSYPYEWTFGMLRDAALLELELLLGALDEQLILKDASSYNVQFRGSKPVFVDVGSFERLREGEPWAGYRQFCMLFLFPLLLQAHRDVPFQPWLRGSIDGITPTEAAAVLSSTRDLFRRGVMTHVRLHARLERRYEARKGDEVKQELRKARFSSKLIKGNALRLQGLLGKLQWKAGETAWTDYRQTCTYSDADADAKQAFIRQALETNPKLVWDMGANDGAYSRIAAERADYVLAFDLDHATVDALYRSLKEEGNEKILPLVFNLADPSPGLGWRGQERRPLEDRAKPDLVLGLALIHHVCITANVPVREFVDYLRDLDANLVIEFVKREDPMVELLMSGKAEGTHPDYEISNFERVLEERFSVERRQELPSTTRVLYEARPR